MKALSSLIKLSIGLTLTCSFQTWALDPYTEINFGTFYQNKNGEIKTTIEKDAIDEKLWEDNLELARKTIRTKEVLSNADIKVQSIIPSEIISETILPPVVDMDACPVETCHYLPDQLAENNALFVYKALNNPTEIIQDEALFLKLESNEKNFRLIIMDSPLSEKGVRNFDSEIDWTFRKNKITTKSQNTTLSGFFAAFLYSKLINASEFNNGNKTIRKAANIWCEKQETLDKFIYQCQLNHVQVVRKNIR